MRYRVLILLFLAPVCFGDVVRAQTGSPAGSILGVITDATTGAPIASASIAVMSMSDSVIAGGTLSDVQGAFRVDGLVPGSYYLRISHIAYTKMTRSNIVVGATASQVNVGTVSLTTSVLEVEGVVATADRADVQMSAERNTYSTRNMPATTGGNVTDVLRNVPSVEVDSDGKVSLRGNDNVAIQINGRAAPARGDQLGQFLQQLPANMVERVEVVPSPSAKYDPDGMAGIVNIVLKGATDLGLSGGASAAAGTGGRYNASGNLGYQAGAITLFGTYGFQDDTRENIGLSERENLFDGAVTRFINQNTRGSFASRSNTLNTTAELKVGARETVGATLMFSDRNYENGSLNGRTARDNAGAFLSKFNDDLRNNSGDLVYDGTLSFRRIVEPRKNEVNVELRYNRLNVDMNQSTSITAVAADGSPLTSVDRNRRIIDAMNDDLIATADVTRTISGVRIETGVKVARRRVTNGYELERFSDIGPGVWRKDAAASFVFGTHETTQAAYTVATRNSGSLELQAGLRAERTGRGYVGTNDKDVSYTDLFPSGLVAYNFGEDVQVKASYSRRINRPQTFMLNSILFYEDALNRSKGNPALRPEYTNAFELGYQRSAGWGSVMVNPFLRQTSGAIRVIRTTNGDTTTGVYRNFDNALSYGMDMTSTVRGDGRSITFGVNAFRHETEGAGGSVYGRGLGWSARANGNLSISKATDVQAAAQYRAPFTVHQGRIGAFGMTNFSVRHKLDGDKTVITLRVMDPFNMMQNRRTTMSTAEEQPYILETERSFGARGVTFGFNYSFGQAPKPRAPRPQEAPSAPDGSN